MIYYVIITENINLNILFSLENNFNNKFNVCDFNKNVDIKFNSHFQHL
jgi:hypothetical protein